jgi:hypothetical protein
MPFVTLPVPSHSGQALAPTRPLPPQRPHTFSPVPGVPAGASSPGAIGLFAEGLSASRPGESEEGRVMGNLRRSETGHPTGSGACGVPAGRCCGIVAHAHAERAPMKYEVYPRGQRLEAIGAHSGYRIRMSTLSTGHPDSWPVNVYVRGSESEDEIKVDVPKKHVSSQTEAFDYGYECATLWIDAQDHRLG